MSAFVRRARPPLEFIPPSLNPVVLWGTRMMLSPWLKFRTNITEINATGVENLARLYHRFQNGEVRFLMAFRHPSSNDPFCMARLLWQLVPEAAREQKISLSSPVHSYFIYDRGIPLWAGAWVGWLYSNLGGSSIQRGKIDLMGLRFARDLFVRGSLPISAAPEGATNGHNEIVSPLEPGIAQLSFWCQEDLLKEGRNQEVLIVPIGIQYHYVTSPWKALEKLLTFLERESGLAGKQSLTLPKLKIPFQKTIEPNNAEGIEPPAIELYQRLYRLGEHLLSAMEKFYREFYHQELPEISIASDLPDSDNRILSARLQNLLDVALKVAEQYFDLKPKGSFIDRCRRLEQAGWDCIYREELKPKQPLSNMERCLADLVAEEASLRMWHMRMVETFVAVTGYYVKEKLTVDRFAETSLLLYDLVNRIKGGSPLRRPRLGKQKVSIGVGEPISVTERMPEYRSNRRQAVTQLTLDLQTALEGMIIKDE